MIQQILGSNYKWWYLTKYLLRAETAYLFSSFMWILSNVLNFLFVVLVWAVSGRTDTWEILSYILIGNIFFALTNFNCIWEYGNDIREGKISAKMMIPGGVMMRYFCRAASNSVIYAVSILTLLIPITLFFRVGLSFNLHNLLYFLPAFIISSSLRFFAQFILGSTTFWTTGNHGIANTYETVLPFLAGSLIPFDVLGGSFSFLKYTPFAYTFYHPMQIYLGKYDFNQIITTMIIAVIWVIIMYLLSKIILKIGLKNYESVGL